MKCPFIHINCASSIDGRISRPDGERMRISSEEDMIRVHRLREEMGAILVGANTVIMDDPKLTVKEEYVEGHSPLTKIVIDGAGRIPAGSRFLRTEGRAMIVTSDRSDPEWLDLMARTIEEEDLDAELLILDGIGTELKMKDIFLELSNNGIDSILVEGGSKTIGSLLKDGTYDRFTVYMGPMIIGGKGPGIIGENILEEVPLKLKIKEADKFSGGILLEFEKQP